MKKECIYRGGAYCLNCNNESTYCEYLLAQVKKCRFFKEATEEQEKE